jgi:kinesin family protein 20
MPPRTTRSKATAANETVKKPSTSKKAAPAAKPTVFAVDENREPMMAYLRIRPHLSDQEPSSSPYLSQLSDVSVRMVDPNHDAYNPSRFRPSTVPPTSTYTFSHVFPPDTTQSDFFRRTTLPLVNDVLQGQNSLLFAYGATNSGKTFTVQGGSDETTAGIVPRTLDVLFNSIENLQGDGKFRPTRLYGVEPADPSESATNFSKFNLPLNDPSIAQVLGQDLEQVNAPEITIDSTTLRTDRNYEYTVYISYAEVYNEKIFDLLASAKGSPASGVPSNSLLLTRQALPLKPSPVTDSPGDTSHSGKYVAGLSQFRVSSAAQAKAVVKFGQLQRRVFGTLANRESSRSHGIVIIKLMRCHRGERNDPTAVQVSRFTVVDLAGSERNKHTGTTGDRLREAGNINKSLMVLGQCLEVMRSNQRKMGMALGLMDTRVDTRDVKKALAVVPFRHSKLTELLMDYFVGDGRAVMIVNVNPYDTGYDENSHVMKFAALAREVYITPTPAPIQKIPQKLGLGKPRNAPATLKGDDIAPRPFSRKVTLSKTKNGKKLSETVVEVMEVDEDQQDGESEELEGSDALIEELFEEIASIRMQLFEAEMRNAVIEAETREEVMDEMQERMRKMDAMYNQRLMDQMQANEKKMNAKINMLHRAGLFTPQANAGDSDEEEDIEQSLVYLLPSRYF